MNEENTDSSHSSSADSRPRSWLERITSKLLGEPETRDGLLLSLREAQQSELIDADALAMIEGVLGVADMQVRDIMLPRSQMVVVERDASPEQALPVIVESAHSRFPVIGEHRDEVVGIVLAKDLLAWFAEGRDPDFLLRDLLRPAVFVPESKRLNVLLREFRASRNHMAIVVDEYGGIAGLVTIEDVLEQIVGEIEDEHDVEEDSYIMRHSERHFTIKALTPVEDFNQHFHAGFSEEEFDTVGGIVLSAFGHLPRRGETIAIDRFRFKVLRADNRRIHLLHMTLTETTASAEAASRDGNHDD